MSLLDMNWLVSSVFPTSGAPSMRTVYLGVQTELFREEQPEMGRSSSSVLERRLERPLWEWLRPLEHKSEDGISREWIQLIQISKACYRNRIKSEAINTFANVEFKVPAANFMRAKIFFFLQRQTYSLDFFAVAFLWRFSSPSTRKKVLHVCRVCPGLQHSIACALVEQTKKPILPPQGSH